MKRIFVDAQMHGSFVFMLVLVGAVYLGLAFVGGFIKLSIWAFNSLIGSFYWIFEMAAKLLSAVI